MNKVYQSQQADWSIKKTQHRLAENQFLLAQAIQLQPHLLIRQSPVGFATDVHVQRLITDFINNQIKPDKRAFVAFTPLNDKELGRMSAMLMSLPHVNSYRQLPLTQLQTVDLSEVVAGPLTLAQLLESQSVQHRYRLHQGDKKLLQYLLQKTYNYNQLKKHVMTIFKQKGLYFDRLEQIALAELLRAPMLGYFGVQQHMHADRSDYMTAIINHVKPEQIMAYYHQYKKRFKYISAVTATAVKFDSEKDANQFYQQARQGGIKSAISKQQLTPIVDTHTPIRNNTRLYPWLRQLLFTLKPGVLSKPVRGPEDSWYVATVNDRNYSYYPLKSETVRYEASQVISETIARQRYQEILERWLINHKIAS